MKDLPVLYGLMLIFTACVPASDSPGSDKQAGIDWRDEVIYHVMPRSFCDSNGDLHGDLRGLTSKLDYLKELGVTTILLTPLYESGFYHNYFPTDYEQIDPEYGTFEDYLEFIRAVHEKDLKLLMDMETQYAQSGHIWFDDSYQNPASAYSDFIYYSDSLNQYPEQIFMPSESPLYGFPAWPRDTHHIVFLDLNHPRVKNWMIDFYAYWVDPNDDGKFDDGVDGFRIDHIMDDLDYKGLFVGMYRNFWRPIFTHCKSINPDLFILGEQSNWNEYGENMIRESKADAAFGFPLLFALSGEEGTHDMYSESNTEGVLSDPERIHQVVRETQKRLDSTFFSVNFLENHDTRRWASVVKGDGKLMRLSAVLNLLLPGVPSIYYGQELGVPGIVGDWGSDVNHIPVREAFPWTADAEASGTALFYKNTGEWWDSSFYNKSILAQLALSTQQADEESLWHHYQQLISIRKKYASFRKGDYQPIDMEDERLMAFSRTWNGEKAIVMLNLSADTVSYEFPSDDFTSVMQHDSLPDNKLLPFGYWIASDGN